MSFTLAFLFKNEINISPNWQNSAVEKINNISVKLNSIKLKKEKIVEIIIGKIKHPKLPEIVLLGLIFVNFGPLKILPKSKPPISDIKQMKSVKRIKNF